jgi:hypothetical protein
MNATNDVAVVVEADWPITNCYIDAWTQILSAWGLDPMAGLGVTVAQDYEGDQFTFFKYQHDDLEMLYGIVVGELTIYRSLEDQLQLQVSLGRVVLVEVDAYYLPDTRATSYRTQHTKTTVGVETIDPVGRRLGYFHNVGCHDLADDDYEGVFDRFRHQGSAEGVLPPYVEFVKRRHTPLSGAELTEASVCRLRHHLERRPISNPVSRYREDFPSHMEYLLARPETFHDYAFGIFRQLGANHELLARHLSWLRARGTPGLAEAEEAARAVSSAAKMLQFKVARIASRGKFDPCGALFDTLEQQHSAAIVALQQALA